jgi:TonB family protein
MINEGKLFQIALGVSVAIHVVILAQNSNLSLWSNLKKTEDKLEVSYVKEEKKPAIQEKSPPKLKIEPFLDLSSKVNSQKRNPPPYVDKNEVFSKVMNRGERKFDFTRPTLMKPDVIAVKKKVTLPPLDMNKIDNPSYISYYQIVREKIRRSAYSNYQHNETGEVYLSFVILSDGSLKDVRISEANSSVSEYLRKIALGSVKEASPFPHFPKELDYPQLSFNVVISFEIE